MKPNKTAVAKPISTTVRMPSAINKTGMIFSNMTESFGARDLPDGRIGFDMSALKILD